jgi:hypothetical protein
MVIVAQSGAGKQGRRRQSTVLWAIDGVLVVDVDEHQAQARREAVTNSGALPHQSMSQRVEF